MSPKGGRKNFFEKSQKTSYKSKKIFQLVSEDKNLTNLENRMDDYDDWKISCDAKSKSQSSFVRDRLARNVDMFSNGESAMKYFTDHITEDALYLLDEPENSLSFTLQMELGKYISDSAKHFGCQFIIATHSPVLLSISDALIYDFDETPVETKKWTELDNVRRYFNFFEEHRSEFL